MDGPSTSTSADVLLVDEMDMSITAVVANDSVEVMQ